MDEVLKAINDKEAKLANSSSNDSSATTTPQHESPPKLMTNGRGSKSPPPPLPVQPPRLVCLPLILLPLNSYSCSIFLLCKILLNYME